MEVQIFGVKKSADTRKAQRFFSERRIRAHFVDLNEKAMSEGELTRFVRQFGLERLIDRESKRYEELGLRTLGGSGGSEARWIERLLVEPLLMRLPLVRRLGQPPALTVGDDEVSWKEWVNNASKATS
jgi:arsenate reductase-like glutaredoxin family protein